MGDATLHDMEMVGPLITVMSPLTEWAVRFDAYRGRDVMGQYLKGQTKLILTSEPVLNVRYI